MNKYSVLCTNDMVNFTELTPFISLESAERVKAKMLESFDYAIVLKNGEPAAE